jgi:hypothetical protein
MRRVDQRYSKQFISVPLLMCKLHCPPCIEPSSITVQHPLSFVCVADVTFFSQRTLPCKKPTTRLLLTSGNKSLPKP